MKALINNWLPVRHSMADIARFANAVYYTNLSQTAGLKQFYQAYHVQDLPAKTALHMQVFREKSHPAYQVIAVRGTVAASDYFYDNLKHTIGIDGMSEYQVDAYETLMAFCRADTSGLPIIVTGHSMGGKISEIILAQLYVSYIKSVDSEKSDYLRALSRVIAVYAFDGPGTFPLIDSYFKLEFGDGYQTVLEDFLVFREKKVFDIVGHPNSVNMCHKHTGYVYYIPNYGRFKHANLEEMVLSDFTKDLVAKHSVKDMMQALMSGEQAVRVDCWGGVSTIEKDSSIRRLNNFFCSYNEHMEQQVKEDPSWKNYAAAGVSKLVFGTVSRSQFTACHPLVQAAKKADQDIQYPGMRKRLNRLISRMVLLRGSSNY